MNVRLALIMALLACSPREELSEAPAEIALLAADALRAASEIKVSGDPDAVARRHEQSPRYAQAMAKHFALMRALHLAGLQSRIRYPRSSVTVRHDQFCEKEGVAHLVVTAMVRYDMEAIPPATGGPPPHTASQEEHVFRFERLDQRKWVMTNHHEISLAEMHRKDVVARLRNPCGTR